MILGYDCDTPEEVAEHLYNINSGNKHGIAHDIACGSRMTYDEVCDRMRQCDIAATLGASGKQGW